MPDAMSRNSKLKLLMRRAAGLALVLALMGLMFGGAALSQAAPEIEKANEDEGYDRPTSYLKIRFSNPKPEGNAAKNAEVKLKTRVFLLDVSAGMAKPLKAADGAESENAEKKEGKEEKAPEITRLNHMIAQMERSLDSLARRKDPRLRFNIVTYGSVQDFAKGGEMQAATAENAKRAKEWLGELKADGEADMYAMLNECFEQEPDSATLIVGSLPAKPANLGEAEAAEFKKHDSAGEYLLEQVKRWRRAGKKTTLDITGVGLTEDEKTYYRRLAEAAGGTYLDA